MSFHKVLTMAALVTLPTLAMATESKQFVRCFGDHHGSYLSLNAISGSEGLAQVLIGVTNDSDNPAEFYEIKEITKGGVALPLKSYSWAIRQAIKAEAAGDWYGYLKVTARNSKGTVLYMNLQKYSSTLRHALVIDGNVEALTCPLDQVQD
jgi:hypothetical protein